MARTRRAMEEAVRQQEELFSDQTQRRIVRLPVARHRDRDKVIEALQRANGNRTAASRLLGISRATLYRKIDEYKIER